MECQRRVVAGIFSARGCDALRQWCKNNPENAQSAYVVGERQVSILQELAFLHAPERLEGRAFGKEEDFSVLTDALLIVTDVIHEYEGVANEDMIAIGAHNHATFNDAVSYRSFSRAVEFYEIGRMEKSSEVSHYEKLFIAETGCVFDDFVLGGVCFAMHQERENPEQIHEGWHAVRAPEQCMNPKEREIVQAYVNSRCGTVEQIRSAIRTFEKDRLPRDFNLIALARYPIVNFKGRLYVLSPNAVGRGLFDGPRHIVTTAALKRGDDELKRVGGAYGQVFQSYILAALHGKFGDRLIVIPNETHPNHADCMLLFQNSVVVIEIKSEHFVSKEHSTLLTRKQRIEQIRDTGIGKSINQIAATIDSLRKGEFTKTLNVPRYDWTITTVVPLVFADEEFPMFPLFWEALYQEMEKPLSDFNNGAERVTKLRIMSHDELDLLEDLAAGKDLGEVLILWANDPKGYDLTFKNFLLAQNFSIGITVRVQKICEAFKILATRLGLNLDERTALKN
ncbi:MAG: hypothetical protein IT291_09705 [Deltaproteobacteria bacterium]|nr:hypothetical protein [Deltaproteobacteria bacterium]